MAPRKQKRQDDTAARLQQSTQTPVAEAIAIGAAAGGLVLGTMQAQGAIPDSANADHAPGLVASSTAPDATESDSSQPDASGAAALPEANASLLTAEAAAPSPAPEKSAGPRKALDRSAAIAIIATLAVLALAADQVSKFFALQNLTPGDPVQILGDFLVFVLVFNPGAAFSLGEGVTWVFTIALAAVAVAIVWLMITRVRSRAWAVVLGLLLGGVLGNLTDRLVRDPGFPVGHVVDFISTPWMMPAIYNVADMFIVCDMIAIALLVLLGMRMDGTRERREDPAASTADPDASDAEASDGGPVSVAGRPIEGVGDDRDALFPVADPDVGAPRPSSRSAVVEDDDDQTRL